MIIVNKPTELLDVQCFKCKASWKMHPMTNMNSAYVQDCALHNKPTDGDSAATLPPRCSDGSHVYDDKKRCIICLGMARDHPCVGGWL